MKKRNIGRYIVYVLIAVGLSACEAEGSGAASDINNPLALGMAPVTHNGSITGYPTTAGENYYVVDIAAGGQYDITLSNFTTDLDLLVFDKAFTDVSKAILCSSAGTTSVETCMVSAVQTATLTKLYVYVTNWEDANSNLTLSIN
ncbi:MAG: hypothetical protein OEX03_06895 [Gammaproteobacteria bacterium]|nr:hypothetical protein [Gammaproteobacteria bacterium]